MADLGEYQKLDEAAIRKIWPREDAHFNPWLAENIACLNQILNIHIEVDEIEGPVDSFKLDLAGTDMASQKPTVIEVQFGKSNHDHLGKLITYSAGREGGIMIWVANEIQLAHRNALEWLNKISPPDISFYGVELEVFTINDSPPAPNFRLVAGPPPSKVTQIPPDDQISPRNKLYQAFFDKLRARVLELQPGFTRARGLPQAWWGLGIGRTGFSLNAAFVMDAKFRVEIYIDVGVKDVNEDAVTKLKESELHIQDRIGHQLRWDYLPDSRASRICAAVDGSIDDTQRHQELIDWAAPMMIKFREVFAPLVRSIELKTDIQST